MWRRAAFLLAALACAASAAAAPPVLVVEGPPSLAGAAEHIRRFDTAELLTGMDLAGLKDPGPPIRVILEAEGSPRARAAPTWISGYTDGVSGVVVLFPSRALSYPHDGLDELLRHEVAHVLLDRAAQGRPLPRWFHEGVALFAGRPWGIEDRTRLTLELLVNGRVSLRELEGLFTKDRPSVERAYATSGAFVRDLLERHGQNLPGRVLARVAGGLPFDEAFRDASGNSLWEEELAFWRRETSWERRMPLVTSTVAIWTAITLLALYAIRRRRRRDADRKRRWEAEEDEQAVAEADGMIEERRSDGPVLPPS